MQQWSASGSPGFFENIFRTVPWFILLVFLIIVGTFAYALIRAVLSWMKNNASPPVSVNAVAVTKRAEVYGGSMNSRARTDYYVTFELNHGERLELKVPDKSFGLIVEGDQGQLSYQGTRFKGFERSFSGARSYR